MASDIEIEQAVDAIARDVVAKHAADVDRDGAFPAASIDALARAGLLGVLSAPEVGGSGAGLRAAARIIERVARECGSTAMVACMHFCGVAVLERFAPDDVRRVAATGKHLSTLAFSEAGSRSQFWAPVGTATARGDDVVLDATKSFVTSASRATAYVWSSKPLGGGAGATLWLVPAGTGGLRLPARFDGLGLRGNDSAPVVAEGAVVPRAAMLGGDGEGLGVMLQVVLPVFDVLSAAVCIGLMEEATRRTATHATGAAFTHSGSTVADLPTVRAYIARMRVKTDQARALLGDTLAAMETGRADTVLRVLECKAAAGESATEVLDLAMRVSGGAAFRKDVGVERLFRDARASTVMAPTTDALYDFIGRAECGMELFG